MTTCDRSMVCLATGGMHLTDCRSQMSHAALAAQEAETLPTIDPPGTCHLIGCPTKGTADRHATVRIGTPTEESWRAQGGACHVGCGGTWPGGAAYHVRGCPLDQDRDRARDGDAARERKPGDPLADLGRPRPRLAALLTDLRIAAERRETAHVVVNRRTLLAVLDLIESGAP